MAGILYLAPDIPNFDALCPLEPGLVTFDPNICSVLATFLIGTAVSLYQWSFYSTFDCLLTSVIAVVTVQQDQRYQRIKYVCRMRS